MLTSVSDGRAFAGVAALPPSVGSVWLERYADAITDAVGQPLFRGGGVRESGMWLPSGRWLEHLMFVNS